MIRKCLKCRGAALAGKLQGEGWVLRAETFNQAVAYHQVKDHGAVERTACGRTITKERVC